MESFKNCLTFKDEYYGSFMKQLCIVNTEKVKPSKKNTWIALVTQSQLMLTAEF